MTKSQLLCTFTTKEHLDDVVNSIKESYSIMFNKIYIAFLQLFCKHCATSMDRHGIPFCIKCKKTMYKIPH